MTGSATALLSAPANVLPEVFKLERYMAKYEFQAKYPLCLSDCEPLKLPDVLAMADEYCKETWSTLSLGYTESDGHPILRDEISKLYETVNSEEIIVLVPQEAIQIASRAILEAGDHVISVSPAYQSLYENAKSIGCEVSFWEMESDVNGKLCFNVEKLKGLFRPDTKALFINFPHNPSGAIVSFSDWQQIISLCSERGAYLFSDEMYRNLEVEAADRLPSAADSYQKSVTLSGMSKSFGMAGLRLGWLITKHETTFTKLQLLHDYYSICHAAPSEILAIIALRNKQQILATNLEIIKKNIALAAAFFDRHKDMFEWHPPQGSSVAFPRLTTGEEITAFCNKLVETSGVYLLPASVYDNETFTKLGHFRLGLGRKHLEEGFSAFEEFLTSRKNTT